MNFEVEERIDRLEALMGQFITQTSTALVRLERGHINLKSIWLSKK